MSSLRSIITILCTVILILNGNLMAQDHPVEFGIDGGLSISFIDNIDNNLTSLQIPIQRFRVGFFSSESFAIEPSAAISILDAGSTTITQLEFRVAGHYHSSVKRDQPRAYFGPSVGFALMDIGSMSDSQLGIGADFGVKLPTSNRLAARFELSASRWFETDKSRGYTQVSVSIGLSFFTK